MLVKPYMCMCVFGLVHEVGFLVQNVPFPLQSFNFPKVFKGKEYLPISLFHYLFLSNKWCFNNNLVLYVHILPYVSKSIPKASNFLLHFCFIP